MGDTLVIVGIILCFIFLCLCVLMARALIETNMNEKTERVYILKATPDGKLKIKRYRGRLNFY